VAGNSSALDVERKKPEVARLTSTADLFTPDHGILNEIYVRG